MAVNNSPVFAGIASSKTVNVSVAKTTDTEIGAPADATDLRLLFTAGVNGGAYYRLLWNVVGTGTPTNAIIHLWETDETGANARVVQSFFTPTGLAISTTQSGSSGFADFKSAELQAGQKVFVSVTALAANTTLNVTLRSAQFTAQ